MSVDLYTQDAREWLGSYNEDPALLNWLIDVGVVLYEANGHGVLDLDADYIGMFYDGYTPQAAADAVLRMEQAIDEYADEVFLDYVEFDEIVFEPYIQELDDDFFLLDGGWDDDFEHHDEDPFGEPDTTVRFWGL